MTEAKTSRRLTKTEWLEAEGYWKRAELTSQQIADKFGISKRAVLKHMSEAGIEHGSEAAAFEEAVERDLAHEAHERAKLAARRIEQTKEDHYKFAEQIAKLTMRELAQAQKDGRPFSSCEKNLKALNGAAKTLEITRRERWDILGIDRIEDEDDFPELQIDDLTEEEIAEIQAGGDADPDDDGAIEVEDMEPLDEGA